ncbi:hypothetical protein AB0C02_03370 [Micromonospora sp. NPDC048999]|uniref:hypothetical protein n=1 Tax=Micromonospora sp. NPDC048999 TaxID=3155391 RepID=UPI0034098E4E
MLLVGVLLTYQDGQLHRNSVFSSIGLDLIAAVIFAVIFAVLSNRIQDRGIEDSFEEGLDGLERRLTATLASHNQAFLPSATYPALDPGANFGDAYNQDLTASLERSSTFAFQGPSARFVAARLMKLRHYPQQIKVVMLDPSNRRAVARRAADRAHWPNSQGKPPSVLEKELREELIVNITSLFDCRQICPVELLYHGDTAVYRYAMCDDAVYLSWYHGPQSAGREMPESYRFGVNSFWYQAFRLDLLRKFEVSDRVVRFEPTDDDQVLSAHLAKLLDQPVAPRDLQRWRAMHAKQTAVFSTYLDGVYSHTRPNSRRFRVGQDA